METVSVRSRFKISRSFKARAQKASSTATPIGWGRIAIWKNEAKKHLRSTNGWKN